MPRQPEIKTPTFLCANCADKRGYIVAAPSRILTRRGVCPGCDEWGLLFNIDDLATVETAD